MSKNSIFRKGLAFVVIILLISITFASSINANNDTSTISNQNNHSQKSTVETHYESRYVDIPLRMDERTKYYEEEELPIISHNIGDGNHPPIYIEGNDEFTPENGVTGGSGTEENPYVIEDWIIVGNEPVENGIFINNTDVYFVIRNCTIFNLTDKYDSGILLSYVENGRIEDTTSFRTQTAIEIRYSAQIEIFNCTSDDYSTVWFASGVSCWSSSYISISSCDFHGKGYGIKLSQTSYSVIDNSSCYNNHWAGISIGRKQAIYNTIKDCKLYDNYFKGIELYAGDTRKYSTYAHIIRCEVYDNGLLPGYDNGDSGINIWNVHENLIEDCSIHHNGQGVHIDASRGNIIRNCSIFGHYLESGIAAEGIQITNDYIGILKAQNSIQNCDIYDNELGIFTFKSLNLKIEYNNISNNSDIGIISIVSLLSQISNNNLYDNGGSELAIVTGDVFCWLGFIDARNNWWGSDKRPKIGNHKDILLWFGIVRFIPWATEPITDAGVQ